MKFNSIAKPIKFRYLDGHLHKQFLMEPLESCQVVQNDQFPRVNTGLNHCDCDKVINDLGTFLESLGNDVGPFFFDTYTSLFVAKNAFLESKRNDKQLLKFNQCISNWNRTVTHWRNAKGKKNYLLPTINTKPKHVHGHVKELGSFHDSLGCFIIDEDESLPTQPRQFVWCSHQSGVHNWPCCVIPFETAIDFLNNALDVALKENNFELWTVNIDQVTLKRIWGNLNTKSIFKAKFISLKCPQLRTDHCPVNTNVPRCCDCEISLSRIVNDFPKKDVELKFEKKALFPRIDQLFFRLVTNKYQELFVYCPKETCKFSSVPFIQSTTSGIFGQKESCPDKKCNTVFCNVCKMFPYHENVMCRGLDNSINIENIKMCPKAGCPQAIERNGGCPHMRCPTCRTHFCWNCMQILNRNDPYRHTCPSDVRDWNVYRREDEPDDLAGFGQFGGGMAVVDLGDIDDLELFEGLLMALILANPRM